MARKTLLVLVIAAVAAVVIALLLMKPHQPKSVTIGFIGPLSGDNAVFGIPQRNAAQLAVDEINERGGVLGRRLILVVEDDRADPKTAVSGAQKLTSSKDVIAVIGHPNSGCAIPASKVYNDSGVVFLTTTATNPKLTQQGYKYIFRFAPTDDVQGFSIAEFIFRKLGHKSVVLLHDNGAYGKGIESKVKMRYQQLGGRILLEDAINPQSRDFKQILAKVKQFAPSVVFYGGMLPEGTKLVKQAKELGLETQFVFGDGCYDETFRKLAGTDCRNVYVSFLAAPVEQIPAAKGFYLRYKSRHGETPSFFAPYAYDAVHLLVRAVQESGSATRESTLEALRAPGFSFTGVTGPAKFDERGQAVGKSFYFYTFDADGKLVLYE